ncbi:protein of unknown function DUF75 [Ignisphaera aggregans DSM 17230]|uniref:Proteasome assembly chaperone family protein n=1 Tax=Ignisphaera aggregans (strain DSM 17230 / JCM 13409 / AQ1.S1) TaxID=583356 RepID=E0SR11_IGNAA|nr:protein of unknown function DUF75 [Ignisphaera aggregans DSM 17230]
MWKLYLYEEIEPSENSIAIVGFPGMGLVGKTSVDYIIKSLNSRHVASIYGTRFPAHLLIKHGGIGDMYKVDLFYAKKNGLGIYIVTGDTQPPSDSDQHSLARFIVSRLKRFGVKEVIAAAAYVSDAIVPTRKIYVVGNNSKEIQKYVLRGAETLNEGVISGINGIIVGWATLYKINSVCLLGETWRSIVELNYIDYKAASLIVNIINDVWNLNIDLRDLIEKGDMVEKEVINIVERYAQQRQGREGSERMPYYIT